MTVRSLFVTQLYEAELGAPALLDELAHSIRTFAADDQAGRRWSRDKILLVKPQTFMNASGDAVQQALAFYKLDTDALTVFHDELDLAPMKVKVKQGGGTAGHNGLRSIDSSLGPDFRRVRIGIGHPGHKDRVTGYVLGNYAKSEMEALSDLLAAISAEADWLAGGDDVRFMNDIARRMHQED